MSHWKEMWIAAHDDLMQRYIEEGMSEKEAHERADLEANDYACDRLADQADNLRKAKKEG